MFGRFDDWTDDSARVYLLESDKGFMEELDAMPDNMKEHVTAQAREWCLPQTIRVWELVEQAWYDDETGSYIFIEDDK